MTLDSTKNSRAEIYNLCIKPLQFPHAIILQTQRIFQHEHTGEKVFFKSFMLGISERCNHRFQAVRLHSQLSQAVLFASYVKTSTSMMQSGIISQTVKYL